MIDIISDSNYSKLYATDASVYEQVPRGVAFPTGVDDCITLLKRANDESFALICRGGGTSIAGQCVGDGVVVDFSRYMAGVVAPPKNDSIWVYPGMVLDDLNDYLRSYGLQFPIDISTSSRCTIGGMVGNNAAGSHSIVYGTTRENVLEVDTVLVDGSTVRFGPLAEQELQEKREKSGIEGNIYRTVFDIIDTHREAILAASPDPSVVRRNTGYALDMLAVGSPWVESSMPFNIASLICGSEGTLALVTAIHLKLAPVVLAKALLCVHFSTLASALSANIRLLEMNDIAACELIDSFVLNAAANHRGQRYHCDWVQGEPAAILVAEFFADNASAAYQRAERAASLLESEDIGVAWPVMDEEQSSRVWSLRKAGLGLLMGGYQRARPIAVIEDVAVPIHLLARFVCDIQLLMDRFGVSCVFYGHASVGLLHLRPNIDLDTEDGRVVFRSLAKETALLVRRYRGSLSGEHGDGRLRAPYLETVFGNDFCQLLLKVKQAFDPDGVLNPGKILHAGSVDDQLRLTPALGSMVTGFDWLHGGGFDTELTNCNGSGNCRQASGSGAMCPTFQATHDELYSTRGRANLLRQAFSSENADAFNTPILTEAMDTCLGCKACRSECPSGVDMTKLKSEYLFCRRQRLFLGWLYSWFIGLQPLFLNLFTAMPPIMRGWLGTLSQKKWIMGVLRLECKPPMLAKVPMSQMIESCAERDESTSHNNQVLLIVDPFLNHFEPEVGLDAVRVLRSLGYDPDIYFMEVSLRWLVSEGFLGVAKKGLYQIKDMLSGRRDISIIGLEPSELLLFRDEAKSLLGDAWSTSLSRRFLMLDEFLLAEYHRGAIKSFGKIGKGERVLYHPHCHERAEGLGSATKELLSFLFDVVVEDVSTGCCGMAGSFGYRHADLSKQVFSNSIRCLEGDCDGLPLLVSGISCRNQFCRLGFGFPLHLSQYLCRMFDLTVIDEGVHT